MSKTFINPIHVVDSSCGKCDVSKRVVVTDGDDDPHQSIIPRNWVMSDTLRI
jgi:hypothetical protein